MSDLPRYTWDQAEILGIWSPDAFAAVGINPATIRKWASRNKIQPAGKGPNGCKLYAYSQVVRHAGTKTLSQLEVTMSDVSHCENRR